MAWNPWRALRDRPQLLLAWGRLPGRARGALVDIGGQRVVVLDERLGRRDRNAVLGHELIHDERDIFYTASTPTGLVSKEEWWVDQENARRLVPPGELAAFVARLVGVDEPVRAVDVMEEFDVPVDVANRALHRMKARSGA